MHLPARHRAPLTGGRTSPTRRGFITGLGASGLAAWLGLDTLSARETVSPATPRSTRKGILRLELETRRLAPMRRFYGQVMGFAVDQAAGVLRIRTGGTDLVFRRTDRGEDEADPIYHVAWAIPENKLPSAMAWLASRTPRLRHADGRDVFDFRGPNRSAVYFEDPAKNVLELVARHNLDDGRPGPFTLADVLYVNHLGVVVDNMDAAIAQLQAELGLPALGNPTPHFTRLGDEHRHLVLVSRDRPWFPEAIHPAGVFPTDSTLHGVPSTRLTMPGYPYRFTTEA